MALMQEESDRIALVDLDGTVADYDAALIAHMRKIQDPGEPPFDGLRSAPELPHVEARRKMIQSLPGFWRSLPGIERGFDVVDELRTTGFQLHVLTKGPGKHPVAWGEKLEWCRTNLPDAIVTITGEKSIVYGRVLADDWPPYFLPWLAVRPRGLVVCVAQPWNAAFAPGGESAHPRVLRYDGKNRQALQSALRRAHGRKSGESLSLEAKAKT
jgi:5'(3')-deoxyribonucleotidase